MTETITVKACDVRKGDVIEGKTVARSSSGSAITYLAFEDEKTVSYPIQPQWQIVVARPLPDPCPRGRMTLNANGWYYVDGKEPEVSVKGDNPYASMQRRIVALWNEAEAATPYRTTAEIEEQTK